MKCGINVWKSLKTVNEVHPAWAHTAGRHYTEADLPRPITPQEGDAMGTHDPSKVVFDMNDGIDDEVPEQDQRPRKAARLAAASVDTSQFTNFKSAADAAGTGGGNHAVRVAGVGGNPRSGGSSSDSETDAQVAVEAAAAAVKLGEVSHGAGVVPACGPLGSSDLLVHVGGNC